MRAGVAALCLAALLSVAVLAHLHTHIATHSNCLARRESSNFNSSSPFVVRVRVTNPLWLSGAVSPVFFPLFLEEPSLFFFARERGLLMLSRSALSQLNVSVLEVQLQSDDERCFGEMWWYWMAGGSYTPVANMLASKYGSGFVTCSVGICVLVKEDPSETDWPDYLLSKIVLIAICCVLQRVVDLVVMATFSSLTTPMSVLLAMARDRRAGAWIRFRQQLHLFLPMMGANMMALFGLVMLLTELFEDSVLAICFVFLHWLTTFFKLVFLRTHIGAKVFQVKREGNFFCKDFKQKLKDGGQMLMVCLAVYHCSIYSLGLQFESVSLAFILLFTLWASLMYWFELDAVEQGRVGENHPREGIQLRRLNVVVQ